jgi:hypothetical protein
VTRAEIVAEVMDRLNLTSENAKARIQKRVQTRYARVTSAIGLTTSRRVSTTLAVNPVTVTTLPDLMIQGIVKVFRVQLVSDTTRKSNLDEVTYEEVTTTQFSAGLPSRYAIKTMGSDNVTITFDRTPDTDSFSIIVDGLAVILELADNDSPVFPADFHEVLVEGAMSDEYRKMEKPALQADAEERYAAILSDLRFFIVKSDYLDIYQGKTKPSQLYYWPWNVRIALE